MQMRVLWLWGDSVKFANIHFFNKMSKYLHYMPGWVDTVVGRAGTKLKHSSDLKELIVLGEAEKKKKKLIYPTLSEIWIH